MLVCVTGRITFRELDRVSPLAVRVRREIGRDQFYGTAIDLFLDNAADALLQEAGVGEDGPQPHVRPHISDSAPNQACAEMVIT